MIYDRDSAREFIKSKFPKLKENVEAIITAFRYDELQRGYFPSHASRSIIAQPVDSDQH